MPSFDLILVTDTAPDLVARLTSALQGSAPGRVAVQLRLPGRPAREVQQTAMVLRELTHAFEATLLINDRVDVALAVEADGVHLPETGLAIEVARKLLGPQRWIGTSRHDLKGLFEAARAGADYATLSPINEMPGKNPPLGISGFSRAIGAVRLPVYALGGVTVQDVPALRQAGARGVAVIREVLSAPDPQTAVAELLTLLSPDRPE